MLLADLIAYTVEGVRYLVRRMSRDVLPQGRAEHFTSRPAPPPKPLYFLEHVIGDGYGSFHTVSITERRMSSPPKVFSPSVFFSPLSTTYDQEVKKHRREKMKKIAVVVVASWLFHALRHCRAGTSLVVSQPSRGRAIDAIERHNCHYAE